MGDRNGAFGLEPNIRHNVRLPTSGLLARNDFRFARNPFRIKTKHGGRFLQCDLS